MSEPVGPRRAPKLHRRVMAVSDTILRVRTRRAREAGYRETVIPYTGYGSTTWVRVLGRVLLARPEHDRPRDDHLAEPVPGADPAGSRGWRSFTSVPVEHAVVEVMINGERHEVVADASGIVDARIETELPPGRHQVTLSCQGSAASTAEIMVVDPAATVGVVSDIDDTVMITALPRPLLAGWHTFVVNEHARSTTPGMPVLYERIVEHHAPVPLVYLSTGAWNVAPTLTRFLSRNLYPAGPLLLTDWGPTPDRWFRSGPEHKRNALRRLAAEFPDLRWILFGDDGQHDEELYAEFCREHPDRALAVCIRQLTPSEAVLAGSSGRTHVRDGSSAAPWIYGYDGAELATKLSELGLLSS